MTLLKETVADFSEKLGFLLGSGVPLVSSLESILAEIQDHDLGVCLHHVLARIKEGGRFSEAMGDFPHLFSPSYLGMVRSAENQGILDTMMPKAAQGVRSGLIPVGVVPAPGQVTIPEFLTDPASRPSGETFPPDELDEVLQIIREGVSNRASDLHFVPVLDGMAVSGRIDGSLREIKRFPVSQRDGVTARIKTLSGLDLGEKYLPQDGRMKLTIEGKIYEIRVNLLPVALGEKLTLQLVLREEPNWSPEHIFSDPLDRQDFANLLRAPFGLIVMAGPTGSGKTTTAYSALRSLRDSGRGAIVSIEHPVGAIIDGVAQIPVRPHLGLGFAEALNAVLRGDPNVIFVSDDPDEGVMARILKCALTGQLVILTLHAADIGQVFQRLLDLKAPPHLLSSALSGVSAQRLVRKVCPKCAGAAKVEADELKKLGWKGKKITAREGKGCPHCNNSGFRGRAAIYEFLHPDKAFKDALQTGDMTRIRQALTKAMRRTLTAAAADLVASGTTTLAEVHRVLAAGELGG